MRLGKVEFSGSFFLLFAWLNYVDTHNRLPLTLLSCLLHESGHLLALKIAHMELALIRLSCVGAQIYLRKTLSLRQECFVAFCGPAVNLLLALLAHSILHNDLLWEINLSLACLNLLPVGQLDGNRILHCVIELNFSQPIAQRLFCAGSRLFCTVLFIFGIYSFFASGNVTLLLVAIWLTARTV